MGTKNTREVLLRTAINLFYQKGYSDTSIREIGAKAGISNSLLYHYFKNKEEILFEIVRAASEDLIQILHEAQERVPDPVECLREMLTAHIVLFSLRRKKEAKIVVSDHYWLRGKRQEFVENNQREIYDIYLEKLKELKERGLLKDVDLRVLNFSIFGMINWFFRWYKEGGSLSKEDVAENIIKFAFDGIIEQSPKGGKVMPTK